MLVFSLLALFYLLRKIYQLLCQYDAELIYKSINEKGSTGTSEADFENVDQDKIFEEMTGQHNANIQ